MQSKVNNRAVFSDNLETEDKPRGLCLLKIAYIQQCQQNQVQDLAPGGAGIYWNIAGSTKTQDRQSCGQTQSESLKKPSTMVGHIKVLERHPATGSHCSNFHPHTVSRRYGSARFRSEGEKHPHKLQTCRGILVDRALAQLEKDNQMKHMPSRQPPPSPACFPEEEQMRRGWKQQAITTSLKQTKAGGGLQCLYTPRAENVHDLLLCPS